LQQTEYLWKYR